MGSTVKRADFELTVFPGIVLQALTFSINAVASFLTSTRTIELSAVGALPTRLTYATARFSTVVAMAIAVGFCSHFSFKKAKGRRNLVFVANLIRLKVMINFPKHHNAIHKYGKQIPPTQNLCTAAGPFTAALIPQD